MNSNIHNFSDLKPLQEGGEKLLDRPPESFIYGNGSWTSYKQIWRIPLH